VKTTSLLSLSFLFAAACGEAPRVDPPPIVPPPDPIPEPTRLVVGATPEEGPALWIEGAITEGDRAHLEIWARSFGGVLGYAITLRHDGARAVTGTLETNERLLGEGAKHRLDESEGAITFGGARAGTPLSEVVIDAPSKILSLEVEASAERSKIELAKVMVRRADGTFVAAKTNDAELILGGAR
jgi:hypothetical protein